MEKVEFKGDINGFPVEVVEKMLEHQVSQGNKRDLSVFEKFKKAGFRSDGFTWGETIEGRAFWSDVIIDKKFDVFFKRYPRVTASEEKPMFKRGERILVWDDNEKNASNRIGLAYVEGSRRTVITVYRDDEEKFKEGSVFRISTWENWKFIPDSIEVPTDPFEEAARPLMKYLCENHHPHVTVIVTGNTCELLEGQKVFKTNEFNVD